MDRVLSIESVQVVFVIDVLLTDTTIPKLKHILHPAHKMIVAHVKSKQAAIMAK